MSVKTENLKTIDEHKTFARAIFEKVDSREALLKHVEARSAPEDETYRTMFMYGWAEDGFPLFRLTHGAAAAFILTDCSDVRGNDVGLPYEAFAVELPSPGGPIAFCGRDDARVDARYIFVLAFNNIEKDRKHVFVQVVGSPSPPAQPALWRNDAWPLDEEKMEVWLGGPGRAEMIAQGEMLDLDVRAMDASQRIVTNLCIHLATENPTTEALEEEIRLRKKAGLSSKTYNVGREIKISKELRQLAASWGAETDASIWKLHSRFMVRGHWRNQAHGPGRSLRRKQWIAPFWKGPEGGPKLDRSYDVE